MARDPDRLQHANQSCHELTVHCNAAERLQCIGIRFVSLSSLVTDEITRIFIIIIIIIIIISLL